MRIYNQDTWRQVTDGHGGSLVEVYIKEIVSDFKLSVKIHARSDSGLENVIILCVQ